ncbi:tRNA (adenine(22)-N(1))-methyltransferase, partial [Cohnella lubricantis]
MMQSQNNGSGAKLSERLSALAAWVPQGARFADIGTDHALLPVYLAEAGRVKSAVAGDVNKGPVEAARRQVASAGLNDIISVRQGDGLTVLAPGEVDTVCIAGMGGSLMVRLLNQAGERLDGVRTLILSPHVAEDQVRHWLVGHAYVLEGERLIEEDG